MTTVCAALAVPRSTLYRYRQPTRLSVAAGPPRPLPGRTLSETEKAQVRDLLNGERFQDQPPREVYATLLDEGRYHCAWRTMYRILAEHAEVRERRNQLRHPTYQRPELLATAPKQLWSWDITKLRGPAKGLFYYLYVILDVFSRYVPGWLIAERESAQLAEELIAETCRKQGIAAAQLTIHADHGSPMIAKPMAQLLADLGIQRSHSRPHVSNDNPYSEAQFRTLKYSPTYPERFGSVADARQWGQEFFTWYNHQHHHTGLALLTPADVHYGRAAAILAERQAVLQQAYTAHPERFVKGAPKLPQLPTAVWINPPKQGAEPRSAAKERSLALMEPITDATP
jgi:putative transposase